MLAGISYYSSYILSPRSPSTDPVNTLYPSALITLTLTNTHTHTDKQMSEIHKKIHVEGIMVACDKYNKITFYTAHVYMCRLVKTTIILNYKCNNNLINYLK